MIALWTTINFFALALLCWLLPVWFVNLRRGRKWSRSRPDELRALPGFWNRARKVAWALGILGLALVLSNGRGLWDDTPFQFSVALGVASVGLMLAMSLELACWNMAGTRVLWSRTGEKSALTKFPHWAPWLLWGITFVGAGAVIRAYQSGRDCVRSNRARDFDAAGSGRRFVLRLADGARSFRLATGTAHAGRFSVDVERRLSIFRGGNDAASRAT